MRVMDVKCHIHSYTINSLNYRQQTFNLSRLNKRSQIHKIVCKYLIVISKTFLNAKYFWHFGKGKLVENLSI